MFFELRGPEADYATCTACVLVEFAAVPNIEHD